jgi:DNA-binding transcriptional ArsR family regulator
VTRAIADLRTDVSMRVEASDTECIYVWTIISSPLAACGGDERPIVSREPNVSTVASLIADPARAAMLSALLDGRALPAGELAHASGVTAQTASSHLSKLLAGGLLALETAGRHRYYRLAGSQVAQAIECLAAIQAAQPVRRKALSAEAQKRRSAEAQKRRSAEAEIRPCLLRSPRRTTWGRRNTRSDRARIPRGGAGKAV